MFNVQVLLILLECWAFCKENKNSHKNNKTGKISPYIVWGAFKAEGLSFYFVSYTTFTGALCSHGACVVLLPCFGKAERADFFWCLGSHLPGSTKFLQMSAENCTHVQAEEAAKALECQQCLVWQQENFPVCAEMGAQSWSFSLSPGKSEQGRHNFQCRMDEKRSFFWTAELQIPLLAQLPW